MRVRSARAGKRAPKKDCFQTTTPRKTIDPGWANFRNGEQASRVQREVGHHPHQRCGHPTAWVRGSDEGSGLKGRDSQSHTTIAASRQRESRPFRPHNFPRTTTQAGGLGYGMMRLWRGHDFPWTITQAGGLGYGIVRLWRGQRLRFRRTVRTPRVPMPRQGPPARPYEAGATGGGTGTRVRAPFAFGSRKLTDCGGTLPEASGRAGGAWNWSESMRDLPPGARVTSTSG